MQRDGDSQADPEGGQDRPEVEFLPPGSIPMPERKPAGFFRGEKEQPTLITEAATSLEQQHHDRVRRYVMIMAFRIPCLVGAAIAYGIWHNWVISLVIIGVSIPLPWIAVLGANDRPPRSKDEPSRWDGRRNQKALDSRSHNAIDS